MKIFGLILAGGKSKRFGTDKLSAMLGKKTVLERSAGLSADNCDEVFVARGGETRFESMCIGVNEILKKVAPDEYEKAFVLIHNGANPGVTTEEIKACVEGATSHGACGVARNFADTVRQKNNEGFQVLDRENLYAMQTPQCIRLDLLLRGIDFVKTHNEKNPDDLITPTDDLQLLDLLNRNSDQKINYTLIEASESNFKITTKDDLKKMRAVLGFENLVGVGQDSHEFSTEGKLALGGLTVDDLPKLKADSDGDVILHALFNAISSALGSGSLGQTADEMFANGITNSCEYLDVILEKMRLQGYEIGNLSISLVCKKPKIDIIENDLKLSLSRILNLPADKIGVTATTGEGVQNTEHTLQCTCFITLV